MRNGNGRATTEYHLIDLLTGVSHGGFATVAGAREYAYFEEMAAWDIWHGNALVERHSPQHPVPVRASWNPNGPDHHYREHAEEARTIADGFVHAETRAAMLRIAATYDQLADQEKRP